MRGRRNQTDSTQHFVLSPAQNGYIRMSQNSKCLSIVGQPPAQPPSPRMVLPPSVNIFSDQVGREIIVVTSPGVMLNGTVQVTVRGSSLGETGALNGVVAVPGDRGEPKPVMGIRRNHTSGDIHFSVRLSRGAAVARLSG